MLVVDRILYFSGVSFYFGTTTTAEARPDDLRFHMGSNCIYDTIVDISVGV